MADEIQCTFDFEEAHDDVQQVNESIDGLIAKGAIFYVSHSGGKDSQAMYAMLNRIVPHEQIVVVHADLGEVEWSGVQDHINENITHPLNVVRAGKTLLGMVEQRGMWPSAAFRQCTSDLKRGPIVKFIRADLKAKGKRLGVNCMGLRAQESAARAKRNPLTINGDLSRAGRTNRTVYDLLPIFEWSTEEVFAEIEMAGQKPFWAYEKNERLSCVFCIMGSLNDLRHGAEQNPKLYKTYVELEKKIGHTIFTKGKQPVYLEDHTGIYLENGGV